MDNKDSSLKTTGVTELGPSHPEIQKLAKRLGWSPKTAVSRISRALPVPLEQQIYLAIAADFGFLPESMAKILKYYLGEQHLTLSDLTPRVAGPNMVTSKFTDFAEFLRECLNLIKLVAKEHDSFSLSINYAALIVTHYGTHEPERLIEMVEINLDELCELFGVSNEHSYSHRMRLCIWLMVTKVIPDNKKNGRPDILDISDILNLDDERRHAFRLLMSEDPQDLRSDNYHEISKALRKAGA
ncbi:MAG: hypothetical protein WAW92_02700 [Minisyncoccia bacterium]